MGRREKKWFSFAFSFRHSLGGTRARLILPINHFTNKEKRLGTSLRLVTRADPLCAYSPGCVCDRLGRRLVSIPSYRNDPKEDHLFHMGWYVDTPLSYAPVTVIIPKKRLTLYAAFAALFCSSGSTLMVSILIFSSSPMHCLTGTVLPSTIICLVNLHDSPGWQEQSSPCGRENKPQSKLIRTGVAKPIHTNQCTTTAIRDPGKYPNEKSK